MQLIRWVVTMWWMGVVVSAGVARAEVPTQQTIRVEVTHVEGTELSGIVAILTNGIVLNYYAD